MIQRRTQPEENENEELPIQTRPFPGQSSKTPFNVSARIRSLRGGGRPLSASTRSLFEPRFGYDFSGVRIHTDSRASETASALKARAFTIGSDIMFGSGEYAPDTDTGQRLMSHELTHVVQQSMAQPGGAGLIQRQETVPDFTEEEVEEFGEETGELEEDTGEAAREATAEKEGASVRKAGRMACTPKSRDKQFLRKTPTPATGENVIATLNFNALVYVQAEGQKGEEKNWYKIITADGQEGWVPKASVALDPPEPGAVLYWVRSGDTAIDLAGQWYKPEGGFERWWVPGSSDEGDARFYIGALAFANKGRAGMPSPADLTERDAWKSVKVIEGHTIWKPSKEFVNALQGKVSSGSISREAWETVKKAAKKVWGWIVYAAAFIAGILYGAGESLYDLFAGLVDLVKMVWSVLKSLFTGNIISDAEELWNGIANLDLSALAEDFLKKWNADDPWDQGFFRGRVIGYVIMEILMLVFSGGILTALKWTGKFAKIGSLIAKLPKLAKVAEAVKAAKIPEKASTFIKARFAGKLGKTGVKILEGVEKGKVAIAAYLKTAEHLTKRAEAFKNYLARGGKKSQATFDKIYDTLTQNRLTGKLAEEQFQLIMKGAPKEYWVTVAGKSVLRKVDNVLGNAAREVKSGPLKLTPFIKNQILKDIQLMMTKGLTVEWHLLAGGDAKAIAALEKAGFKVVIY